MTRHAVSRSDVLAAAERLAGVAIRTPLIRSHELDELVAAQIALKPESLQRTGAFKFRGAFNAVSRLPEECRGVVAHSSGNHAAALALAARLRGLRALVAMPTDAPASKIEAAERYGAEIVPYDRFTEDRVALAESLAVEHGLALVKPFDHPDVIAGQGTVALEMLQDADRIDAIVVPVSGGGLLAGCALAAEGTGIPVFGVEPASADDFTRSLAEGARLEIEQPTTIADGLRSISPGALTFPIAQRLVAEVVTVTEEEIRAAQRLLFSRAKLVVEPSGAVALAGILSGRVSARHPGVVLSGGNVGTDQLATLTEDGALEQPAPPRARRLA
jgi:threonine dehydratase